MADILSYIHNKNIVHKDLNPSNILINPSDRIIHLIDFGISSVVADELVHSSVAAQLEGTLPSPLISREEILFLHI